MRTRTRKWRHQRICAVAMNKWPIVTSGCVSGDSELKTSHLHYGIIAICITIIAPQSHTMRVQPTAAAVRRIMRRTNERLRRTNCYSPNPRPQSARPANRLAADWVFGGRLRARLHRMQSRRRTLNHWAVYAHMFALFARHRWPSTIWHFAQSRTSHTGSSIKPTRCI